ncbi:MAG: type II toxin-antitoxin system HicB family antitoxin [Vicinamibacterales bacterium]
MASAIQAQVLDAAVGICRERGSWTFELSEIIHALPDLNPQSVRTHVTSRCCVNAPANHAHRWSYFRRVGRGKYEVMPAYRRAEIVRAAHVREAQPVYAPNLPLRSLLHAVITRSEKWYVAEVLELPVVTQARTLDEIVTNVREAVGLHLRDEDRALLGLADRVRVAVSYETGIES